MLKNDVSELTFNTSFFLRSKQNYLKLIIECDSQAIQEILDYFRKRDIKIISFNSTKSKVYENKIGIKAILKVGRDISSDDVICALSSMECTKLAHKVFI